MLLVLGLIYCKFVHFNQFLLLFYISFSCQCDLSYSVFPYTERNKPEFTGLEEKEKAASTFRP